MKLGVFTACLQSMTLDESCAYLKDLGVQEIEIGAGGYPGTHHCDAIKMVNDEKMQEEFISTIKKYDLGISALSVHNNPVHPNKEVAEKANLEIESAVLLAEKFGIPTVVTFSGCPGDCEESKLPNWPVSTWPNDYAEVRKWQWEQKLIPYWKKAGAFAKVHGVKIALEIHPGFSVYNTATMLQLIEGIGDDAVGANVDPSHLFWQGMDPVAVIHALKGYIYHFHAKDTKIDKYNTAINGVIDTKSFTDVANRPWVFRSMGYGNGEDVWREIFSALQVDGYTGVVSIEHEDALMSPKEGLETAIKFLKNNMIFDEVMKDVFWA